MEILCTIVFYLLFLATLVLNGLNEKIITDFAPAVSSGYSMSRSCSPRIMLTRAGHLITDVLGPQDSGTYTFSSANHGGATLIVKLSVLDSDKY